MIDTAWAVTESGRIIVSTVRATRRGAIVSYLVMKYNCITSKEITDNEVEAMWFRLRDERMDVVKVVINKE